MWMGSGQRRPGMRRRKGRQQRGLLLAIRRAAVRTRWRRHEAGPVVILWTRGRGVWEGRGAAGARPPGAQVPVCALLVSGSWAAVFALLPEKAHISWTKVNHSLTNGHHYWDEGSDIPRRYTPVLFNLASVCIQVSLHMRSTPAQGGPHQARFAEDEGARAGAREGEGTSSLFDHLRDSWRPFSTRRHVGDTWETGPKKYKSRVLLPTNEFFLIKETSR